MMGFSLAFWKKPYVRRAIVLAGGGSRGAYQVGVWRGLRELKLKYHIVTGSSVGSLNGALMVTGDYANAIRLWENISNDLIMKDPFPTGDSSHQTAFHQLRTMMKHFMENGGMDVTPLEDMVESMVDEKKLRRSKVEYGLVTVQYPDFKPVELFKSQIAQGEIVDYMLASAACFPAFRAKTIGEHQYIDGGYFNNLPVNLALQAGATEIIAVDLDAIGVVKAVPATSVPITYIRSYWPLGNFLLFVPDTARRNMELGYLDCLKAFGKLDGWAYAYTKGWAGGVSQGSDLLAQYLPLPDEAPKAAPRLRQLYKTLWEGRLPPEAVDARARHIIAGEIAGELLGLSPLAVYSAAGWRAALEGAYDQALQSLDDLGQLDFSLSHLRELVEKLQDLHTAHLLGFVCRQLAPAIAKNDNRTIRLLQTVVPREFIGSLYLLGTGICPFPS